jgi:hypothetical protein
VFPLFAPVLVHLVIRSVSARDISFLSKIVAESDKEQQLDSRLQIRRDIFSELLFPVIVSGLL